MATSESSDYDLTATKIINSALRKLNVQDELAVASGKRMQTALEALNVATKALQDRHIFLWTIKWVQKTFTASSEVTGSDGSIYTCILSHTSASTNKPITGANWTTYWVLRGDTGGAWVDATDYSSIGDFSLEDTDLDIMSVKIRDGGNDYDVNLVSRQNYMDITSKDNLGRPYMLWLDRQLIPRCYLSYQPDNTDYVLHLQKVVKLQDFDKANNDPDVRASCLRTLIFGTAADLAFEYPSVSSKKRNDLKAEFEKSLLFFKKGDSETDDHSFVKPAYGRRRR